MTSAETRFENDRVRARQATMGSNEAARNALRTTVKRQAGAAKLARPSVVPVVNGPINSQIRPPQMPSQAPQGAGGSFDETTDRLLKRIRFEKLLSSPEVQDAVTKVNLQDYYNDRISGPERGAKVLDIVNTYLD